MKTQHGSPEYGKGFYAFLGDQATTQSETQLSNPTAAETNASQSEEAAPQITATEEQIELLHEAYPDVLNFCRYINPDHADDLVQTATVQFLTKAHTLQDNRNIRGWLNAAALNAARQYWRRDKEYPDSDLVGDMLPLDRDADPLGIVIRQENHLDDLHTLSVIEEHERRRKLERLDLAFASYNGKSHGELATEYGTTPGAISAKIHRFRAEIRELSPETFQRPMVRRPNPYSPPELY